MSAVIDLTPRIHENLMFELLELVFQLGYAAEGQWFEDNLEMIDLVRRVAEATQGQPSDVVKDTCKRIWIRDLWEPAAAHQRRPGVFRRLTAERIELAALGY